MKNKWEQASTLDIKRLFWNWPIHSCCIRNKI